MALATPHRRDRVSQNGRQEAKEASAVKQTELTIYQVRLHSGYKYLQPSQAVIRRISDGVKQLHEAAPFWGHSMAEIWPKGTWNVFADRGVRDFGDFVGVIPSSVFGVSDSALPAFRERYGRFGELLEINIRKRGSPHVHLFNTLKKIDAPRI